MMPIIFINTMIVSLLMMTNWSLKKRHTPEINKFTIFECGLQPFSSPRLTFSLPYFIITLIFLIFDIEISLIFPFIINMNFLENYLTTPILLTFIILLILGLYVEWYNNAIEWINL